MSDPPASLRDISNAPFCTYNGYKPSVSSQDHERANSPVTNLANDFVNLGITQNPALCSAPNAISAQTTHPNSSTKTQKTNKGRWTPNEDKRLTAAIKQYGTYDWNRVATFVKTRNARQCSVRWAQLMRKNQPSDSDESAGNKDMTTTGCAILQLAVNAKGLQTKKKQKDRNTTAKPTDTVWMPLDGPVEMPPITVILPSFAQTNNVPEAPKNSEYPTDGDRRVYSAEPTQAKRIWSTDDNPTPPKRLKPPELDPSFSTLNLPECRDSYLPYSEPTGRRIKRSLSLVESLSESCQRFIEFSNSVTRPHSTQLSGEEYLYSLTEPTHVDSGALEPIHGAVAQNTPIAQRRLAPTIREPYYQRELFKEHETSITYISPAASLKQTIACSESHEAAPLYQETHATHGSDISKDLQPSLVRDMDFGFSVFESQPPHSRGINTTDETLNTSLALITQGSPSRSPTAGGGEACAMPDVIDQSLITDTSFTF